MVVAHGKGLCPRRCRGGEGRLCSVVAGSQGFRPRHGQAGKGCLYLVLADTRSLSRVHGRAGKGCLRLDVAHGQSLRKLDSRGNEGGLCLDRAEGPRKRSHRLSDACGFPCLARCTKSRDRDRIVEGVGGGWRLAWREGQSRLTSVARSGIERRGLDQNEGRALVSAGRGARAPGRSRTEARRRRIERLGERRFGSPSQRRPFRRASEVRRAANGWSARTAGSTVRQASKQATPRQAACDQSKPPRAQTKASCDRTSPGVSRL